MVCSCHPYRSGGQRLLFSYPIALSSYLPIWSGPIAWEYRELMEVGAALGLVLGVVLGAWALWRSHIERHQADERGCGGLRVRSWICWTNGSANGG